MVAALIDLSVRRESRSKAQLVMYYPCRQLRTHEMRELGTILPAPANESVAQLQRLDASVYTELMRLARAQLGRSGTISMDAPSLVHEAYLRFAQQRAIQSAQRNVFLAYAARVMRTVIVDYVRERHAQKRGGGEAMITLTTGIPGTNVEENEIAHLHETLKSLEQIDPRAHVVVEMRYFGGMSGRRSRELVGHFHTHREAQLAQGTRVSVRCHRKPGVTSDDRLVEVSREAYALFADWLDLHESRVPRCWHAWRARNDRCTGDCST